MLDWFDDDDMVNSILIISFSFATRRSTYHARSRKQHALTVPFGPRQQHYAKLQTHRPRTPLLLGRPRYHYRIYFSHDDSMAQELTRVDAEHERYLESISGLCFKERFSPSRTSPLPHSFAGLRLSHASSLLIAKPFKCLARPAASTPKATFRLYPILYTWEEPRVLYPFVINASIPPLLESFFRSLFEMQLGCLPADTQQDL